MAIFFFKQNMSGNRATLNFVTKMDRIDLFCNKHNIHAHPTIKKLKIVVAMPIVV